MNFKKSIISTAICMVTPIAALAADHHDSISSTCGDPAPPLLSVADFNGDGVVNDSDIRMMKLALHEKEYFAIYDRNADGKLNKRDLYRAKSDYGQVSSPTDQQLAKMYQRFSHIQNVSGYDQIMSMNYQPFGGAIAFHGQHWNNTAGQLAIYGLRTADHFIAEGINVTDDGNVAALFWGEQAVPLFNDPASETGLSTLDWPSPTGVWNVERVQAFADSPPDFFPDTEADRWHTHAGICLILEDLGNGPEFQFHQQTSNAECQVMPSLFKIDFAGTPVNPWGNMWMLHAWMFDLNPKGVFGNTHPCVSPDAPSEHDSNGGRVVPPFFQHHN